MLSSLDPRLAVRVQNVTKSYPLGSSGRASYGTLRESVSAMVRDLGARVLGSSSEQKRPETIDSLADVSFEIPIGSVVGVIGANGAGKSTLLKVIGGITDPTSGYVDVRGRVASLLEVGTGFHPELTGRENIFLNGAILGMSRSEINANFDAIVEFSGVARFLDTPVKRYSSGMYVRLAFAVAAHLEPEVMLVDEVLAVGDSQFQAKCLGRMREIGHSGRTVLFVSHNMAAMRQLCSECIVLDGGRVVFRGSPSDAIATYLGGAFSDSRHDEVVFTDKRISNERPAIIRAVRLNGAPNLPASLFNVGAPWRLEIEIEASGSESTTFYASAQVFNEDGTAVYHLCSHDQTGQYFEMPKRGVLSLEIGSLMLYPGKYTVDLYIGTKWTPLDHERSAIAFEVTQAAGLGPLRPLVKGMGLIHAETRWLMSQANTVDRVGPADCD